MNFMEQIKQFINMLDHATQLIVVKKIATPEYRTKLYSKIAKVFSKDVLANILDAKASLTDLTNED